MKKNRRSAKSEVLEGRLLLSSDPPTIENFPTNITTTDTTVVHMQLTIYNPSINTATLGDNNLIITGPNAFPGTIKYAGFTTVNASPGGEEIVANYDLTENVPLSENGNTYAIALAANQIDDGEGGTYPAHEFITFQVQIPTPAPITILDGNASALTPGSTIDFGDYPLGSAQTPISKTIGIRNDGSVPITVTEDLDQIRSPYLFTSPSFGSSATQTIAAGDTVVATITLGSQGGIFDLGMLSESLLVDAADPTPNVFYAEQVFTVSSNVVPAPPRIVSTIDVSSRKPAVFTDASGSKVTVRLSGPGTATLGFGTTGNADIKDLTLNRVTLASSLTIMPVGGGDDRTSITGDINVTGSLSHMTLTRVDLPGTGGFAVSGAIGNLTLGNIAGLEQLDITGLETGHPATHLHFTAGTLVDTTLGTAQPITSVKVASWTDTHAFDSQFTNINEQIATPSLGEINSAGDFTVGVDVFNDGSLGRAKVGGSLGADPWIIAGNAGNLRIGAIPAGFSTSIGGKLNSLTIDHDDAGTIAAGHIGKIIVKGDLTSAKILAGVSLGTDGRIGLTNGNGQDSYSAGSIDSLRVDGTATNAFVSAGFEPVDGLFDNAGGAGIGGKSSIIKTIDVHGGLGAGTLFVANAFKSVRIPNKINPAGNAQFVILPVIVPL